MSGMSFIGSYSGVDSNTIDKLMAAEKMPLTQLSNKKTSITEQANAWKDINTRLNSLFDKVKALQSKDTFSAKASSSTNDKNVSMTAGRSAVAGTYKINVKQLATSASKVGSEILKEGQDNKTGLELTGKFSINIDLTDEQLEAKYLKDNNIKIEDALAEDINKYKNDYKDARTVTIGEIDSLNDITANINAKTKDTGVNATIIDGRLVLTHKETGERNINLQDVEGSLISGTHELPGLGLNVAQKNGSKAIFNINGVENVTSDSNTVNGVIEAATINLTKVHAEGESDTVTIAQNNTVLTKAVQEFVDQYNSTITFIEDKMKAGDPKVVGSKGTLAGDSSLMRLHSSLRNLVTSVSSNKNTDIKDMSQIGVTTIDKFGQLQFDAAKLTKALNEDTQNVMNFFISKNDKGEDIGFAPRLNSYVDSFISKNDGLIKGKTESFERTLKDLSLQIDNFSARMERKEAYYIKTFSALDVAMMKAEDQMSWLQGQVDSMNGIKR